MTETSKGVIPISKKWDYKKTYGQLKKEAIYGYYSNKERYPVKIVLEEKKAADGTMRVIGVSIGTWNDGIIIATEFSAPQHTVAAGSLTRSEYDTLVDTFLEESGWR